MEADQISLSSLSRAEKYMRLSDTGLNLCQHFPSFKFIIHALRCWTLNVELKHSLVIQCACIPTTTKNTGMYS